MQEQQVLPEPSLFRGYCGFTWHLIQRFWKSGESFFTTWELKEILPLGSSADRVSFLYSDAAQS